MMQRRRTKLSPRGTANAVATPANAPHIRGGMTTPSGLSQTSDSAKPVGSLPHFARQTKSSLQRNAQRVNDVRVPFSQLSENRTPHSSSKTTLGTKASHTTDKKSQIAKTPKPGFLSSFGAKRSSALKDKPGEAGLTGPVRAPSQRNFLGISPPWQQKGANHGVEPSPKSFMESHTKPCPSQRLTVDTSQSASKPAIETTTFSERLGISPVWAQQQEGLDEEGSSSAEPTTIPSGTENADGTTPSSATMTTLLGVFSTFADVWVQPALDETASTESVEDIPSSVLVRPRESLGGVSEISDGSASLSLDESSELDTEDESSSSTSTGSVMSSLGSSTAQSQPSATPDVLSIGGSDIIDREEEEDDNETLLQLPEGLRLPSRAMNAATPRKELQEDMQVLTEQGVLSTTALLSPPQMPSVVMEQYQRGMPSICVGRLLVGADDDSSEDMSTSTLKSELEKYMHSIFSPADRASPCDELDSRNLTALHAPFYDDDDPRCTIDGIVDDSILLSDEQLLQHMPAFDETPAIDEALRMFSTEDFDSVALFADLSDGMDDSIFSVVSDPLLQLVQSNCAFLDETQRKLLSDHPEEMHGLDTADEVQPFFSPSPSLEKLAWLLTPKIDSAVSSDESIDKRRHTVSPHERIQASLENEVCNCEERWAPGAETAAVESSAQLIDRHTSTEHELHASAAVQSPSFDSVDAASLPLQREEPQGHLDSSIVDERDQCVHSQDAEVSTNELLPNETLEPSPADEIRALRIQVELLTQMKEELESLLKVAVRELVESSTCSYRSEDEALGAIRVKAHEATTINEPSACFPQTIFDA
jgi:hypothetical protein